MQWAGPGAISRRPCAWPNCRGSTWWSSRTTTTTISTSGSVGALGAETGGLLFVVPWSKRALIASWASSTPARLVGNIRSRACASASCRCSTRAGARDRRQHPPVGRLRARGTEQRGAAPRVLGGDTGYSSVDFQAIGAKFGPIDLGLIPIGAYAPRWFMAPQHVDPDEAVKIHKDIPGTPFARHPLGARSSSPTSRSTRRSSIWRTRGAS